MPSAKIYTAYREEGNTLHSGVALCRNDTPEKTMELIHFSNELTVHEPATVAEHNSSI